VTFWQKYIGAKGALKMLMKSTTGVNLPTFYEQLSHTKMFFEAFMYLKFGFVIFC